MNDPSRPAPSWLRSAGRRLGALWPVKLIGISAGMTVFFAAYFWVLHHPAREPIVMPLTRFDLWIGFHPAALSLYLSLWVYVSLAPGLIASRRELAAYALAAVGLALAGLGFFQVLPTIVPSFEATWAADSAFAFLKNIDASGNACPSLHVAFAVFTAFVLARQLRQLAAGRPMVWLNWLWCGGIVYSTMATRQHVLVDVIAGAILGVIFAVMLQRWLNRAVQSEV
jgi:membrane-associated phospholipid phosphatase